MLNYFYAHFAVKVITVNRDLHTKCRQAFAAGEEEGRGGGLSLTDLAIFVCRGLTQTEFKQPTLGMPRWGFHSIYHHNSFYIISYSKLPY